MEIGELIRTVTVEPLAETAPGEEPAETPDTIEVEVPA